MIVRIEVVHSQGCEKNGTVRFINVSWLPVLAVIQLRHSSGKDIACYARHLYVIQRIISAIILEPF